MRIKRSNLLILLLITILFGCENKAHFVETIDDVKTGKIAITVGTTGEKIAYRQFPNAQIMGFDNRADLIVALTTDKVDAVIISEPTAKMVCRQNPNLIIFPDKLNFEDAAIAVKKGRPELLQELNNSIDELKAAGYFPVLEDRWFGTDDAVIDEKDVQAASTGEQLIVGIDGGTQPFCFLDKNQELSGYSTELAYKIGEKMHRKIVFENMYFSSLLAALQSGKIDVIIANMTPTEERKKAVDFTQSYYSQSQIMLVKKSQNATKMSVLADINGKKVGVLSGTIFDQYVQDHFKEAKVSIYTSTADILIALKTKKIDATMLDLFSAHTIMHREPEIGMLADNVFSNSLGYGFNKNNPQLLERFNQFLKEIKDDGTYDKIYARWCTNDPEKAELPTFTSQESDEHIVVGVSVADLPYVAIKNGKYVGFDIEMLKTFGQYEHLQIDFRTMEFSSLISALASGKVDIIADGIAITPERQKQINFSDGYLDFTAAVIVLKENLPSTPAEQPAGKKSFWDGLVESFNNNIILENRYLLIWDGLKTTVIISILSALFGTLLGAIVCFFRMSKAKVLKAIASVYISLLRGTPVLVLLMIIFYIIFASVNISPIIVAVFAFGLNFAAYVSEMFRTGIEGINRGQTEAGIALGFNKLQTFFHIVLPQAIKTILPVYKGELISMVKMTSVVGYIAVEDLTKASDLIRSRTFDAFFPLIMVTILYFLISWILLSSLGHLEKISDPKSRRHKKLRLK